MTQYCEYCNEAAPHGDSYCYCEAKGKMISEKQAQQPNKCKAFVFNEMSVFDTDKIYKPRTQKPKVDDGEQICIGGVSNG